MSWPNLNKRSYCWSNDEQSHWRRERQDRRRYLRCVSASIGVGIAAEIGYHYSMNNSSSDVILGHYQDMACVLVLAREANTFHGSLQANLFSS